MSTSPPHTRAHVMQTTNCGSPVVDIMLSHMCNLRGELLTDPLFRARDLRALFEFQIFDFYQRESTAHGDLLRLILSLRPTKVHFAGVGEKKARAMRPSGSFFCCHFHSLVSVNRRFSDGRVRTPAASLRTYPSSYQLYRKTCRSHKFSLDIDVYYTLTLYDWNTPTHHDLRRPTASRACKPH